MHQRLAEQLQQARAADGSVDLDRLLREVDLAYSSADGELERLRNSVRAEADARFNVVMDNVGEAVITIGL
ncbi:MAG: hypothetical protein ACM3Q1_01815, partial [Bacteroidales bacterium]